VLQVAKKEPVTAVQHAFYKENRPARYPLVAGTRHSSRKGVFAKARVLIDLCLMEMWTIFRLGSYASHKNNCSDLSCKFQLP
jgi:hypothetical protein